MKRPQGVGPHGPDSSLIYALQHPLLQPPETYLKDSQGLEPTYRQTSKSKMVPCSGNGSEPPCSSENFSHFHGCLCVCVKESETD